MNPIAKMLIDMARFYGYELDKRQLEMYVEVLKNFDPGLVLRAGSEYVANTKNTRFPIPPHKILESYLPNQVDDDGLAKEAAARIVHALVKYGYTGGKEAKDYIGEIGWAVVSKQGGWVHICENWRVDQVPSLQAQWRDLARVQIQRARSGNIDVAPMLPQGSTHESAAKLLVSNLAKQKQLEDV